jgi:hypothetical protein
MNWRDIEKAAKEQAWRVERTTRGHRMFVPPDPTKRIVYGPGTPSDHRSIKNTLASLRRQGLIWPPRR